MEKEWVNTVLKKGTIADKLAAHTLLIHESKNWASLATLIGMVDPKKCRRQCIMAMMTLKELFVDSLNFKKKNSFIETEEDRTKVKFYYAKFVDQLNLVAFDNLEETRRKAIWVLAELLRKYSENKDYILEKLVEKLGDKVPKLASTAGHLVEKTINSKNDDLRSKAIHHISRFLKRPNQTTGARFYAVSLLTRIKLIKGNFEMANDLMQIYLDLYSVLTKEKRIESKLMSAILVGIHRAYPYSKLKNDVFEQHLQTLYTLVHRVNFRMSVVAMILIKNIVQRRAQLLKLPIEDRFFNLIFSQLLRPDLQDSSRLDAFANLLLSTLNEDPILERKEAFVKRMLQVALSSKPELSDVLLSTVTKIKGLKVNLAAIARQEDLDEDDDDATESWVHKPKKHSSNYEPFARNPRSANSANINELYLLRQHYDTNLAQMANNIVVGVGQN